MPLAECAADVCVTVQPPTDAVFDELLDESPTLFAANNASTANALAQTKPTRRGAVIRDIEVLPVH